MKKTSPSLVAHLFFQLATSLLFLSLTTDSISAQAVASPEQTGVPQEPQQPEKPTGLTVEKIFGSKTYSAKRFTPAWEATGKTYVRKSPSKAINGASDLISVDPTTHEKTVLFAAEDLVPTGASKSLSIASHQWSADRELALIFTNTRKVWRHHSRGDYWLMDLETKNLRQIGKDRPATSLMFAKFSPDAKYVAYVSEGDIYMESVADGIETRLTKKRTPDIINGTSDWVYEEEFSLKDCFRWCPNSQRIAYWEFDTSEVGEFVLVNNTDTLYPTLKKFKHTKPGQKNSAVRMGVINLSDKQTTWLQVPGDPCENYLARAHWVNENELMLQHLDRPQHKNSVLIANANTGKTRLLFADSDPTWVETNNYEINLNDGKEFVWLSEKGGWRQVYRVDAATGQMKRITDDKMDVVKMLRVTNQEIYFIGSKDNATQRYLYRCPLEGGAASRVTPDKYTGWNSYDISPDGSIGFQTYSSMTEPPVVRLVELPSHKLIREIETNESVKQAVALLAPVEIRFEQLRVSETDLDAWVMKPVNFDPAKKYPLIVFVYGEPAGTTVRNQWDGGKYLWHRMMAEKGYVICSIDNRGTKVPRGRDFRKSIYGKIGIIAPQDQAVAVRLLLDKYDWLDSDRVGVWGWSGGGSMTLNALFKHPDLYHTGVSIAPVPNMLYYDSIYQERYQGIPSDNPTGYRDGSPIHFAKNLKGKLLVIHGTGDDNCHYQTVELLLNELVKHDKQFSMFAYPNRSHSINEGENTTIHLRKMMAKFFLDNLPAGGR